MATGLVDARWVAAYAAELPDKTQLIPGETVVKIPEGEAHESDNWEIVAPKTSKRGES